MVGRGQQVLAVPIHLTPTALTGTCTDSYVSVRTTPFFYTRASVRKMFKILNTHAANPMKYRIRGCSSLLAGAMVNPKIVITETVLPGGLTDPEIETITDPYSWLDVQVANETPASDATYHVEAEFASQ